MMFRVHALEPVQRNVSIDLRRRNVGVAEDCLNSAQVGAVFYHVGGTTVAQHVRTGVASSARRCDSHHLPDSLAGKLLRTSRDEQERRSLPCR